SACTSTSGPAATSGGSRAGTSAGRSSGSRPARSRAASSPRRSGRRATTPSRRTRTQRRNPQRADGRLRMPPLRPRRHAAALANQAHEPTVRVLVVDDHAVVRAGLRLLLDAESGIETVGAAGSAREAVFENRAHKPDVILMDLVMPGENGIEAT